MQNTVHYMRFGKGAHCAAVAMLVNEAYEYHDIEKYQMVLYVSSSHIT